MTHEDAISTINELLCVAYNLCVTEAGGRSFTKADKATARRVCRESYKAMTGNTLPRDAFDTVIFGKRLGAGGITRAQFVAYCKVRDSGVTNMHDVESVSRLSGRRLTPSQVFKVIENFDELTARYGA